MITLGNINHFNRTLAFYGLSSDTKPIDKFQQDEVSAYSITNGSTFLEIDTGDEYMFDYASNTWNKMEGGGATGAINKEVVDALPTENIDPNTMYLLRDVFGDDDNTYTEYMYVNNNWEALGPYVANVWLPGTGTGSAALARSGSVATGDMAVAEGNNTTAARRSQHVFGEYNISDAGGAGSTERGSYVEIAGNGTSSNRSNARTLDWNGNEWLAGTNSATDVMLPLGTGSERTSLKNKINAMQSDVEAVADDVEDYKDDLALLTGRVNEMTSLEEGSTTGDAELADIRVGADGTQYVNAGTAVREQISELKSALNNIYYNDLTKSESASGWYIYPYTVKAGFTYTFKNTSTTSAVVSFRTRYTEQGSMIDSHDEISPGKQYTFVASGDANYLRINYTAAGSFKIICRETISEVYNYVDSFDISGIKTDILHTLSAEKSTASRVAYPFDIKNGHHYMLKNTSASAAVAASTRSSAQSTENIQVITRGLTAGKSILFTATADAPILSLYTDGAGSFTIYDYDTVRADIDKKGNTFLPYQEGYIAFTVPVNQTIPDMSDTSSTTVDSENIVDVDCVLRLPTTYTQGGKPSRLLMICHGATHGVTGDENWPSNGSYNQLMTAFVGAGYVVFDCNGYDNTAAGHDFWGAPRGVEAWRKAYQYIVDNYNVEHEFCIYGFSMGGLTALSLAFNRFPNIKAIGLGSCVLRLDLCIGESSMRTAYGITGETYDTSKTIGSNPYAHLLTIGNEQICDYALPPIKIWYGSTETGGSAVYVNKQYAEDFVNAIVAGGGFAQYREVARAGHSMSYGNIQAINTEFIYWFNRFND